MKGSGGIETAGFAGGVSAPKSALEKARQGMARANVNFTKADRVARFGTRASEIRGKKARFQIADCRFQI